MTVLHAHKSHHCIHQGVANTASHFHLQIKHILKLQLINICFRVANFFVIAADLKWSTLLAIGTLNTELLRIMASIKRCKLGSIINLWSEEKSLATMTVMQQCSQAVATIYETKE